jgi:hypothetical protein
MLNIKEIALKVGLQAFEEHPYDKGHVVSPSGYTWIDDNLIEFAESFIAEVAKQNEPVAEVLSLFPGEPDSYINARAIGVDPFNTWTFPQPGTKLYTFPPTAEQIANETAEAIARMLENGSFLTPESRVALAANGAAKAIRRGAWKEFK